MAHKQNNQARAEFDFDAQPGSGELSIRTGDILTILRENIEGGWVEGRNVKGKVGLFPASYVTKSNVGPPPSTTMGRYITLETSTPNNAASTAPPAMAPPLLPPLTAPKRTGGAGPFGPATAPPYEFPPTFDATQATVSGAATSAASIYPALQQQQQAKATVVAPPPPPIPGFDAWDNPVVAPSYATKNNGGTAAGGAVNRTMPASAGGQAGASPNAFDDDFDDDWSDDDEEVAKSAPGATHANVVVNGRQSTTKEDSGVDANNQSEECIGGGDSVDASFGGGAASDDTEQEGNGGGADQQHVRRPGRVRRSMDVKSDLEAVGIVSASSRTESSPTNEAQQQQQQEFTAPHSFAGAAGASSKMVGRSRSTGPETVSMSTGSKLQQQQGGTTRMKNLNRFSNFVKTGMEGYILASAKFTAPPGERHEIVLVSNGGATVGGTFAEWRRPDQIYNCMITKPKKESKLKGLKCFIAYSLTSSLSGIQVSRRYKHFDWLHFQFTNKYLLIPIPPLPEKQVAGRYEEDLIEHRRQILQLWVNKICRHPVLGQSEVWRHFMTCTDEAKWKKGKRQAERDEYIGGNFFNCITAPNTPLDLANVERQVEQFARSSRGLEESCRNMYERVTETQKRLIGPYKANWQKMATAFDTLGQSLELDQSQANNPVKNAIKTSAHFLHKIGAQHEEHGRKDLEQLLDFLFISKGVHAAIPDIVNVHKSVLAKMRENERLQSEGKIPAADADAIRQRVDVCSYAMLAEMQHQQEERDLDLATMFGAYFSQQAAFYHNIGNQLTQLAALYKPGAKQ